MVASLLAAFLSLAPAAASPGEPLGRTPGPIPGPTWSAAEDGSRPVFAGGDEPPLIRALLPVEPDAEPTTADFDPRPPAGRLRGCFECVPGDLAEGEPVCFDGYVDAYNGGCNASPVVASLINCGQSVCGTYGTYLSPGGSNFRDTDWYRFTLTQPSDVTWTVTGEARTRIFILGGTCPASPLGTAVGDPCTPVTLTLNLAAGSYYAFVGTDAFSGLGCGLHYRATLTTSACCDAAAAQPGDTPENEPVCLDGYVDGFNGGCNSTPYVSGIIGCGQTVAGAYGTYVSAGGSNFRDTDWYRFTLAQESTVTWTAVGEARTRLFILGETCPAGSLGTAVGDACTPVTLTLTLGAGTYHAFVATDAFSGVACGLRYRATLTTGTCCAGVVAQPGDIPENEPLCADGYVDAFNGGCNSMPAVSSAITCGQTVAGLYGTYLTAGGSNFRDTDWYRFTLTETSDVTWAVTGEAPTRIFILAGTCPAGSLGTAAGAACTPVSLTLTLDAGSYYAFVGTEAFSGLPCGLRYRATLTTTTCCDGVLPRPGDSTEGEPPCADGYVDTFNGGCNSTPPVSAPIACGQTVAGVYGTYLTAGGSNFRDTDWYRFTLTEASEVSWTVTGEARTRIFILDGACPASSLGTAVGDPCTPVSITLTLDPGSYHAFVATEAFSGLPCGLRYRARLLTDECDCPPDWNGDGAVTSTDISAYLTAWLDSIQNGNLIADFNGDNSVNSSDISAFLTAWLQAVQGGC